MGDYWKGKNVFVTGCTGFVGSWLTERLVGTGAHVIGLIWDDDPNSNFYRLGLDRHVTCVGGDIRDFDLLGQIIANNPIDTVFHLAAQALVTTANAEPLETFETNARGTWLLLEALRTGGSVKRIVVASTDKVYGDQETLPYVEEAPLLATNPYDVSKTCADRVAQSYAKVFGLPIAVIRCGNIYGGGDLNFDRVIPGTIKAAILGQEPVIRSDGTYSRDYLYVADAVDAYLQLGRALDNSRSHGDVFNFGCEQPYTVLDVVYTILELMERTDLRPIILNTARNEIRHQYLSSAKARTLLRWAPRHTLVEGLRETIPAYQALLREGPSLSMAQRGIEASGSDT